MPTIYVDGQEGHTLDGLLIPVLNGIPLGCKIQDSDLGDIICLFTTEDIAKSFVQDLADNVFHTKVPDYELTIIEDAEGFMKFVTDEKLTPILDPYRVEGTTGFCFKKCHITLVDNDKIKSPVSTFVPE